jgi:hypothetical protein
MRRAAGMMGEIPARAPALVVALPVEAYPKHPRLLSGNQPIRIGGDWRSPTVAPAPGGVEDDELAWLPAPLAALLPFIDLGRAEDAPRNRLIAKAREAAAQPPGDG